MYTYVVIDDETLMRKGIQKKLEPLSHLAVCIGEANDGEEALSVIEKQQPDIIITDMNMPVMDGTRLLPLLSERFPRKQIIVISGYKDFDYMKHALGAHAVDYLLKPFGKEDIQAAVSDAISRLENSAAITNQLQSSEEKSEMAHYEYDIQLLKNSILGYHHGPCTIASQKLTFINRNHDYILMTLHAPSELPESSMQNFLEENGFGDLALYLQHNQHKNLGFLILFIPEHSPLPMEDLCRQIIRSLNRMFDSLSLTVTYGISKIHISLSDLHDAFIQTVNALNTRKIGDFSGYYFYQNPDLETVGLEWEKLQEFLFRLEAGMWEEASLLLEELFALFSAKTNYSLYSIKMYCFRLSDQARYMLREYLEQVNPDSANSSMQNILNSMFHLDELKIYYQQYFQNISLILKKQNIYGNDDVIEKMKIYMARHYQNNLTIEFLSSLFYMNRSYLSHVFKERTGDTFVNHLNQIRLTKAKLLLKDTDKKMYQIAKQTGYDNTKYFFRVFKKYEHMTPEQYRLSIHNCIPK